MIGGGIVRGIGLAVTDSDSVAEGVELPTPLGCSVPEAWKVDDSVEFDMGYGAELLGGTPDVPPVGKALPVTEAALSALVELAVEFGWYDDGGGREVLKTDDSVPDAPVPNDIVLPVGPGAGSVKLVRGYGTDGETPGLYEELETAVPESGPLPPLVGPAVAAVTLGFV